jgi:hypothetical protein
VLAAKTVCHFAGDTPENLIRRVNHVPFTRNLMGFCGKRLHDRSKKIAAPNVFFPACSVRIEARAGSPWFFLRGRGCGKALNYKGICYGKSKRTGVARDFAAIRSRERDLAVFRT